MHPISSDTYPRLLGDIGGTNARFACISGPGQVLERILTLPCADFPGPREAIEHYISYTGQSRPRWCAFGIANPVDDDFVRMTNHHWAFSIRELQAALGLAHLEVLNDFTALALALPSLELSDLRKVGGGVAVPRRAIALVGAGTGLGISGLIPHGNHEYSPIEGEGGHITLAASDAHEAAVVARLAMRFPHVSAERILSGPGIKALYEAECELAGSSPEDIDPATISARAVNGICPICVATLETFCAMLGTVAANLALVLGARGGLYIGGGIVPKLGEFFERSPFRARFEQKGRFSGYLAQIPTYVICAPYPALMGAAHALEVIARDGTRPT